MKNLYKWCGLTITTVLPLAAIACQTKETIKPFSEYFASEPTVTNTSAKIIFKELDKFVGNALGVQIKKTTDQNWGTALKLAILNTNKNSLEATFSQLESGQIYDIKVVILKSEVSNIIVEELGIKVNSFTTTTDSKVSVTPIETPTKTPTDMPTTKELNSTVEITAPTKAEITITNAQPYIGKTITLKYKENKLQDSLKITDYFTFLARTATSAMLSFESNALANYEGKKLKVEYRKNVTTTLPKSDSISHTISNPIKIISSSDSATLNPKSEWSEMILLLPKNLTNEELKVNLINLETDQDYDLKLSIVEEDETKVIKVLGEQASSFRPSSANLTPILKEKKVEITITNSNAPKVKFNLENLNPDANYIFALFVDGANANSLTTILPYNKSNVFSTSNASKVEKLVVGKSVAINIYNLLKKYEGITLTVTLTKNDVTNTQSFVAKALVEKNKAHVVFDNLIENSDYKIQLSYAEGIDGGKLIDLDGIEPNHLNLNIPTVMKPSFIVAAGPENIYLNSNNAIAYKGKNIVVKYAPKDVAVTEKAALDSFFAKQVTATVTDEGHVEIPLLNLERKNATENLNTPRDFIYKAVLEGSDLFITEHEFNTVTTTPYLTVKSNRTGDADKTIIYSGNSAKVKIIDVEKFKGKKLQILAIPTKENVNEFTANFFPIEAEDKLLVKKSEAFTIAETDTEKEFKIQDLDSAKEYVFQVFVENEKSPLLRRGYVFTSNATPKSDLTLISKNNFKIKVSKLSSSIGSKIRLKYAPTLEKIAEVTTATSVDSTNPITQNMLDEVLITDSNKDAIEFTINNFSDTTNGGPLTLAYVLEVQPSGETEWFESKQVLVNLPNATATPIVGGLKINLANAQSIAGKKVTVKYKKVDSTATDYLLSTETALVAIDGTAVFNLVGLEADESYIYQIKIATETGIDLINSSDVSRTLLTLSLPKAIVTYPTAKTAVNIKVAPLYNEVGKTLVLQYRKSPAAGAVETSWTNFGVEQIINESQKMEGVSFDLINLEASIKYEFRVISKLDDRVIVKPVAFQNI